VKKELTFAKGSLVAVCLIFSMVLIVSTAQAIGIAKANGETCMDPSECASGNCIDGYCVRHGLRRRGEDRLHGVQRDGHRGTCWAASSTTVCRAGSRDLRHGRKNAMG